MTSFNFKIITDTDQFKKLLNEFHEKDLFINVCKDDYADIACDDLHKDDYLYVPQKSKTWLALRLQADGTASVVGKLVKSPTTYPVWDDVRDEWIKHITHAPFEMGHVVMGHMKWGVDYEDPALVHFALYNNFQIVQVGTIRLESSFIDSLRTKFYAHNAHIKTPRHLLISPDGIVQKDGVIIGLLEIKCISPFHYMGGWQPNASNASNAPNSLVWCENMDNRQWYTPDQIPFVYITQICLQAIAGMSRLKMPLSSKMWFIRWSPDGFSQFEIGFEPLVKLGVIVCGLYFGFIERIKTISDASTLYYSKEEIPQVKQILSAYRDILSAMTHVFIPLNYEEFNEYRESTKNTTFVIGGEN